MQKRLIPPSCEFDAYVKVFLIPFFGEFDLMRLDSLMPIETRLVILGFKFLSLGEC